MFIKFDRNFVAFWSQIFFIYFFQHSLYPGPSFDGWTRTNDPRMARQVVYHCATPLSVSLVDKIMKLTKSTKKFFNFQFRRFLVTQLLNLPHSLFF